MERKRRIYEETVKKRLEKITKSLATKQKEYATENPFHNFETAARIEDSTPEKALWGFMLKHFTSVQDIVHGRKEPTKELVDEKVSDMVNYLIILEAIYNDKLQ